MSIMMSAKPAMASGPVPLRKTAVLGNVAGRPAVRGVPLIRTRRNQPTAVGRQQVVAVKAAASDQLYICIDCGYIYDEKTPFTELKNYQCPQCSSGKKRFKKYSGGSGGRVDNSRKAVAQRYQEIQTGQGLEGDDSKLIIIGAVAILAFAGGLYTFLNSQF